MDPSTHPAPDTHRDNSAHTVEVELNGTPRRIRGGEYRGRELKIALDVPVDHELERVVDGEFRPIHNDDELRVHGGEKFVSHCGQGSSS
jgi:hypothetical protein